MTTRPTKFRVMNKKGIWHGFELPMDLYFPESSENPLIQKDDYNWDTWTEFTGLKDKNGKEIYEGDIVKYAKTVRGEVKLGSYEDNDGGEHFGWNAGYGALLNYEDLEVIGNIYENKDLIK